MFLKALNLAVKTDLREMDQALDEGDEYTFELGHLKGGADTNVAKLVDLIEHMERTVESLMNLNSIAWEDAN